MDNKITNLDLSKELKLLENELIENEKIFSQVKIHYDKMMKSSNPASRFITEQTANIMNIRNSRISIIKEMIGIKRAEADMELREYNAAKVNNDSDSAIQETAKQVYSYLMQDNNESNIDSLLNKSVKEENNNNENNTIDKDEDLLEKRMKEIQEAREKEKQKEDEENIDYIIACDMNKNLYALSLDGSEILDNIDIPKMEIEFVTDSITGELSAINQNGEEIIIIEIE